jgi:phage protein U
MMMSLGQFVFSLNTLAFEELKRQTTWRHPSNSRVGQRPARQFVGPGDDLINLTGVQVPEFMGTRQSLPQLRDMADSGRAWAMVDGAGGVYGAWVIEGISETGSVFVAQGVPRRVSFDLSLARVDDNLADASGGVNPGEPWPVDWWI